IMHVCYILEMQNRLKNTEGIERHPDWQRKHELATCWTELIRAITCELKTLETFFGLAIVVIFLDSTC
ncbi:hypothetical protein ACJX0J_018693, partial [Zea mays]